MALFKLTAATTSLLLDLPESGMGFQLMTLTTPDNHAPYLVLNGEFALELPPDAGDDYRGLATLLRSYSDWTPEKATTDSSPRTVSHAELLATRLPSTPLVTASAISSNLVHSASLKVPHTFHRFSAFNPDRRVLMTGDFLPGTYTCPDSEVQFVPSGLAAVGRFALPVPLPAIHHYQLTANNPTFQTGTVAPAFGQAGGGVEVHFTSGMKNIGTKASTTLYPY